MVLGGGSVQGGVPASNYDSRMISIEFIYSKIGVNACFMRIFGFHIVE